MSQNCLVKIINNQMQVTMMMTMMDSVMSVTIVQVIR